MNLLDFSNKKPQNIIIYAQLNFFIIRSGSNPASPGRDYCPDQVPEKQTYRNMIKKNL